MTQVLGGLTADTGRRPSFACVMVTVPTRRSIESSSCLIDIHAQTLGSGGFGRRSHSLNVTNLVIRSHRTPYAELMYADD